MGKILVIGAAGQLGHCLKKVAENRKIIDIIFPAEKEANILDLQLLNNLFSFEKPSFVINCAAYTAVDQAEDEQELAKAINEQGAANLAHACKDANATLIHISTDFVFEGNLVRLLAEDDVAAPINIYGRTKLDGEIAISNLLQKYYTIRTSWLYSEYGNNFVKTMIRLSNDRKELNIIADQVGTPTYGIDLAGAIFDIIQSSVKHYGIYHYSNEGVTSWYDFAKAIFEISEIKILLNPIPGAAYPTKAKRPLFSVMDKSKIKTTFNLSIPYWRNSLEECIKQINKNNL
jgi:dTDP-4-dehydrorhamnose reductase